MNLRLSTLILFIFGITCCLAEDESQKSNAKVSDFKAKLAKTELLSKPSLFPVPKKSKDPSEEDDDISFSDLGITVVPPEQANDTIKTDHHTYYNSTFYSDPADAKRFWINLDELPENHVILHDKLSDAYRQATTIELTFDFPFYGIPMRNVTIATGGFLYMGEHLHNWIAATQYVAPLMANFDTRLSDSSNIKYYDNGTAFTVLWENVFIQNRLNDGTFTFQVTLLKNGDIIFAYKDIPYPISSISDLQHPVKVGLSDAYILERIIFFVRRKTVYEYNRIHLTNWDISNNTALYFTALPTCNSFQDCSSCLLYEEKLGCNWCEKIQRCSDGIDRQRQVWLASNCVINKTTTCPAGEATATTISSEKTAVSIITNKATEHAEVLNGKSSTSNSASVAYNVDQSTSFNNVFDGSENAAHLMHGEEARTSTSNVSPGAIATIMVFLVALAAASVWIFYAYKYPQSSSGQFLIKYRPSQWSMKKESAVATSNSRHL